MDYLRYVGSYHDFQGVETENISEKAAQEEYENFKKKLKIFESVSGVEEAKQIAKAMFKPDKEINLLLVGNAKCAIILSKNLLRILLKNNKEFICYNFKTEENTND